MALSPLQTEALLSRLKPGHRVASMGYPDMIADLDLFAKYMDVRSLDYRQDSEAICARHGMPFRGIPDAHSVMKAMRAELDIFDIVKERGCEYILDLNMPRAISPTYDFVLDVGTAEHCFNIGNAARIMAGMLVKGGFIIHENPLAMLNHGFYSIQPTWYADFYGQEGFKLLDLKAVFKNGNVSDIPHTKRFMFKENVEANVFAVAERTEVRPICWPQQSKYRALQERLNGKS